MGWLRAGIALGVCVALARGSLAAEPTLVPILSPTRPLKAADPAPTSPAPALAEQLADFARGAVLRATARKQARASEAGLEPAARQTLRRLLRSQAGRVRLRPGSATPRSLEGDVLEPAAGGGSGGLADRATALRLLRRERALFRMHDPDAELALEREETDPTGRRHLRFAQRYAGLRVWPAELIVHLDDEGDAYLVNGASAPTPHGVALAPGLEANAAAARARSALAAPFARQAGTPELLIFAPGDRAPRLAWRIELDAGALAWWNAVIDAQTGEVLLAENRVQHVNVAGSGVDLFGLVKPLNVWSEGGTNYLVDTSKPMYDPTSDPPSPSTTRGGITVLDALNQPPTDNPTTLPPLFHITSVNPNAFGIPAGVSASWGLARTYDHYLAAHARNSIDGAGGSILGVVRYGAGYENAFWHGGLGAMFFGDGSPYARALDVVGHELTHGVVDSTARLIYQGQSGAANESFADVLGEMVEASAEGAPDWLLGADLGFVIRNMQNPSALGLGCGVAYPDRMSRFLLPTHPLCGPSVVNDAGGVHLNSGILNRAFFLLAAGLPNALGTVDAERIFYRALALHLTSNANFLDVRLACVSAATELFGAGSSQVLRTAEAFDTVEIYDGAGTGDGGTLPPLPAADSTLLLRGGALKFLDRRETLLGDPPAGSPLSYWDVALRRVSPTRDGSLVWFVDSLFDACVIATDADPISNPAEQESCAQLQGQIASIATSPDGNLLALVAQDPLTFERTNELVVVDLAPGGVGVTYTLDAPTRDGSPASTLLFADALYWNASGDTVIFDALNELPLPGGGSSVVWSIYALERASGGVLDVVSPLPGASFDFPALGHTSDAFITFDAVDTATGSSTVYAGDLVTGALAAVDTVIGREGVPGFTGDDLALVYSEPAANTTGSSLFRHALAADHLTPSGVRTSWLTNADFGVIYRRGAFAGPPPDVDLDGIGDATDVCPFEADPGQADSGGVVGVGDACECGDLGTNGEVGDDDVTSLRNWLARAPLATPALQRCSVRGGIECDVVDFAALYRARLAMPPGVAPVCAAASPL